LAKQNNIIQSKSVKEGVKLKDGENNEILKKMEELDLKSQKDQNKLLVENTFMNNDQSATAFIKGVKNNFFKNLNFLRL
jgi:hypothetical protein